METMAAGGVLWIVALVAYIATGRVARRSPHYGGGTVVLSWVGLLIPCCAWIALYQGWTALDRAVEDGGPQVTERAKDKSRFTMWLLVYVFAAVAGSVLAKR